MTLNLSLGCAPFKIWVKQKEMKQTIEEAAREELNHSYANKYVGNGMFEYGQQAMINMFIRGAI